MHIRNIHSSQVFDSRGVPTLQTRVTLENGATGIREIVISLGGDGALFISGDGVYRASALKVEVKSTVGAGDAMVAAMVFGHAGKLPREEKLRLAVAMGAASVMQSGSQPPEADLVWELAKQVKLEKL